MHCLKFGRVSRQLFYTAIVFVLLSPAVLFSQDLGIPAGDIQRPAKGMEQPNAQMGPRIPPSMKVVAVRVSADDTVVGLLNPGSKVDVIGVIKRLDPSTNQTKNYSRTFLKALQVYSIGNRTRIDKIAKSGNSHASSIVGLLVTEKQSEALVFVQNNGSLKLVLRGDDVENDGGVGPFEEIRKALSKEDFKAYEEIRNLRALINDQEQVLQQFQKRLERLESLEQVKPSK